MILNGLENLRDKIDRLIEAAEKDVAKGGCVSYEMYKNRCGYIQGLKTARGLTVPQEDQSREAA